MAMRYRHVYLLVALLLLLMLRPFVDGRFMSLRLVDVLLALALIAAALATTEQRARRATFIAFVIVSMGIRIVTDESSDLAWRLVSAGLTAAFLGYVTLAILRDVLLRSSDVSMDTICGSLSGYLLLGFLWSFAYAMLEMIAPGSFEFGRARTEKRGRNKTLPRREIASG